MTSTAPIWSLALFGALFGAIIGSFVATLVLRWPAGQSVVKGRSACDGCGKALSAVDLVPLASFVAYRGRARCCGAPIAGLHPLTEALAAAIGAAAFGFAPMPDALAGALFGWVLLALALLDWRHLWLPEPLTIGLAIAGLAIGWIGIGAPLPDRLIGGIAGFVAFEAIRLGYRWLRKREGMGGGDVRLFGAIGLWLGWRALPIVLLMASLAGLAWALVLVVGRKGPVGKVPFGAFLSLAAWLVWLLGQTMLTDQLGQ